MSKLRKRATIEEVKEAIDSLHQQGQKATADNILAEIIRLSNGSVGSSKGTVLRLRQQLESTEAKPNSTDASLVLNTESKPNSLDETQLSTLKSELEVQLWAKLETRLEERLSQISNENLELLGFKKKENLQPKEFVEQLQAEKNALQAENIALQEQVTRLKAVVEDLKSEKEFCPQPVQSTKPTSEPTSKPTTDHFDQILNQYRALIQQKRTEIEESKILQTPDWRTKKARWPKLVDFVLELERIDTDDR